MFEIIYYAKGSLNGTVGLNTNGYYYATTETESRSYKTKKGAKKFMSKKGYSVVKE